MYFLDKKILQPTILLLVGFTCLDSNSRQHLEPLEIFLLRYTPYYEYKRLQISSLVALFQGQHGHAKSRGRQAGMVG